MFSYLCIPFLFLVLLRVLAMFLLGIVCYYGMDSWLLGLPWLRIQYSVLRSPVVWTAFGISPQFRELLDSGGPDRIAYASVAQQPASTG